MRQPKGLKCSMNEVGLEFEGREHSGLCYYCVLYHCVLTLPYLLMSCLSTQVVCYSKILWYQECNVQIVFIV